MNIEREIERLRNDVNAMMEARRTELEWVNYSNLSTIDGWSSFTTKTVNYMRIGKLVFVQYVISGVSNKTVATFTLPYTNGGGTVYGVGHALDNGGVAVAGAIGMGATTTVVLYPTVNGGSWTASLTKTIAGQFWYVAG